MIKLSARLQRAAEELGKVRTFADIGTDHGKLIVYALENEIAERAFAVDISCGSLEKARRAVKEHGLDERTDFFCGDGLTPLKQIPDAVVIAGMGGNETVKIISDRPMDTRYILLPHQDAHAVRRYLVRNGFDILKDYVIRDGKFYSVIVAERGRCEYDESAIILGANNPPTEEFRLRLLARKAAIEDLLIEQGVELSVLQSEIRHEYKEIEKWLKSRTS